MADIAELFQGVNLPQLDRTLQALRSLPPDRQEQFGQVILALARAGLDPVAVQGTRSREEQDRLFNSGRGVTRARGGQSFHNYGAALDVVPASLLDTPNWSPDSPLWKRQGEVVGGLPGVRWGGNFKSIYDPSHVELATTLAALGSLAGGGGADTMRGGAGPDLLPGQVPPSEYALSMPDFMAKLAGQGVQAFNFGGKAYRASPGGAEPFEAFYDRFAQPSGPVETMVPPAPAQPAPSPSSATQGNAGTAEVDPRRSPPGLASAFLPNPLPLLPRPTR